MFYSCFKPKACSIIANDVNFFFSPYNLDLALSEFEIIKSGNPRWEKKVWIGASGILDPKYMCLKLNLGVRLCCPYLMTANEGEPSVC